jgi:hypothetical protein
MINGIIGLLFRTMTSEPNSNFLLERKVRVTGWEEGSQRGSEGEKAQQKIHYFDREANRETLHFQYHTMVRETSNVR